MSRIIYFTKMCKNIILHLTSEPQHLNITSQIGENKKFKTLFSLMKQDQSVSKNTSIMLTIHFHHISGYHLKVAISLTEYINCSPEK